MKWLRDSSVHLLIAIVSGLLLLGGMSAQVKANSARIEQIEQNQITPREYQDVKERLDRIEVKLDMLLAQHK